MDHEMDTTTDVTDQASEQKPLLGAGLKNVEVKLEPLEQASLGGAAADDRKDHVGASALSAGAATTTNSPRQDVVLSLTPEKEQAIDELLRRVQVISEPAVSRAVVGELMNGQVLAVGMVNAQLLQVATTTGGVYVFDLLSAPKLMNEGRLRELLESQLVPKVMHLCGRNSRCLWRKHKVTLRNVFDTQAAHAVLQQQELGVRVDTVGSLSLWSLCETYGGLPDAIRDQWPLPSLRARPLARIPVYRAAYMVACLVPNVYTALCGAIKPEFQPLLKTLSEENLLFHLVPDLVRKLKRQRRQEHLRRQLDEAARTDTSLLLTNPEKRVFNELKLGAEASKLVAGHADVCRKRIHSSSYKVAPSVGAGTKRVKMSDGYERPSVSDAASQTASTGTVYITKAFFQEESLN